MKIFFLTTLSLFTLSFAQITTTSPTSTSLANAHAHNDYEHERPLYDALSHGFTSFEADIYLIFGELFVGHSPQELSLGRTIESLYLAPLYERIQRMGGSVYGDGVPITLLVDIKTGGEVVYPVLETQLMKYKDMLSYVKDGEVVDGAVKIIISGSRPREMMEAQTTRYAFYDGRLDDLGTDATSALIPLISDDWTENFTWLGEGEMPEDEREKLEQIVNTAHENGQTVRFWATPDEAGAVRDAMWEVFYDAGVDHINTDDLAALEAFLRSKQ